MDKLYVTWLEADHPDNGRKPVQWWEADKLDEGCK